MESTEEQAAKLWHHALKLRKMMTKNLEKLKENGTESDLSQFDLIEKIMEKFRLACVHTIFLDFEYASSENADDILWTLHTSVNTRYRRVLEDLKQQSHAVEKRKTEKLYDKFLRISQQFYKGYIQRLAARYDIPDLQRITKDIQVEQMQADDMISPVPQELHDKVLNSCYKTVIALGDLSRYRNFTRPRKSVYDTALAYYNLARDLMPESGHAYAQMSIMDLTQEGKLLDVIYNCYRSCVVPRPHPPGKHNLEAKFKTLLQNNGPNRRGPPSPDDAFITWFCRLHAHFYQGKTFPQYTELETEVVHRLDMAAKSAESVESAQVLLKMTLINISAYHVAIEKCSDAQKANAALQAESYRNAIGFCQYTLRINILFITKLCRVVQSELEDAVTRIGDGTEDSTKGVSTPVMENLFPVLRIYTMWLAGRYREIGVAAPALGGVVPGMYQALAKAFTLLFAQMSKQESPGFCPYLLDEDIIIRGLKPLGAEHIPIACQCYVDKDGNLKPEPPAQDQRLSSSRENMARTLDILRCAWFLREGSGVPIVHENVAKPRINEAPLLFLYADEGVTQGQGVAAAGPVVANLASLAKPVKAINSVESAKPAKLVKPAKPAKPAKTNKPAGLTKTDKPAEPARPTKIEKAAEHVKPTKIDTPVEPARPTKIDKAAEHVKPTKIDKLAEPARPTKTDKAAEPVKSTKIDKAAEHARPTKTDKAAEHVKPTKIDKAAEPAKPTKTDKAAEPVKSTKIDKAVEPARPTKTDKPAEPAKPTKLNKPAKPAKNDKKDEDDKIDDKTDKLVKPAEAEQPRPRQQRPVEPVRVPAVGPARITQFSQEPAQERLPEPVSIPEAAKDSLLGDRSDQAEITVREMLSDFMKPPTPSPPSAFRSPEETSYGMHTATENEVFTALRPQTSPNSPLRAATYVNLPWDWMFTPKPQQGQDLASPASKAAFSGELSPDLSMGSQMARRSQDDVFTTPRRQQPPLGLTPRSVTNMPGSPCLTREEEAHRNQLLQSLTGTSAPRTSVFGTWGQNTARQPIETIPPSSWGQRDFSGGAFASSGTSAFSHSSSLYQGTPMNGANFGRPAPGYYPSYPTGPVSQENAAPNNRVFQMDETASNYNAAILQSAFYNNK